MIPPLKAGTGPEPVLLRSFRCLAPGGRQSKENPTGSLTNQAEDSKVAQAVFPPMLHKKKPEIIVFIGKNSGSIS